MLSKGADAPFKDQGKKRIKEYKKRVKNILLLKTNQEVMTPTAVQRFSIYIFVSSKSILINLPVNLKHLTLFEVLA